jgi:DnaJ family protein A protein 2
MFSVGNKNVDPADLLIEKDISLAESLCGFQLSIPFLDGKNIYFSYGKIIKNNEILVVAGKGMPRINTNQYGDLYIKINVKYPDELQSNTKNRVWQLLTGKPYIQKDKSHEYIECVPIEQIQQNNNDNENTDNENGGGQQCPVS